MGGTLITHLTEPVQLEISEYWELIQFLVSPKMTEAVILALVWLDKWKPFIWWEKGMRVLRLPIRPIPPSGSFEASGETEPPADTIKIATIPLPGELLILSEYRDLVEVFNEKECDVLPPHRLNDCTIEFLPGAKLPKPKMYAMTPP